MLGGRVAARRLTLLRSGSAPDGQAKGTGSSYTGGPKAKMSFGCGSPPLHDKASQACLLPFPPACERDTHCFPCSRPTASISPLHLLSIVISPLVAALRCGRTLGRWQPAVLGYYNKTSSASQLGSLWSLSFPCCKGLAISRKLESLTWDKAHGNENRPSIPTTCFSSHPCLFAQSLFGSGFIFVARSAHLWVVRCCPGAALAADHLRTKALAVSGIETVNSVRGRLQARGTLSGIHPCLNWGFCE
jgi:hypothetical protein